ncbi:DUF6026 family protein [Pseudomonas sp. FP2196]|uniref:DUF6026 family protein n=1 Tax=Pseudomonas sp. FP2196 TaxID=2954086 RepID=UPI0027325F6F|nr:DUF6026 family protein [Pseudomonas sp. FP2196]WLH38184.1 DUF6026 family protein [Pseudomonas sp. FP2196]
MGTVVNALPPQTLYVTLRRDELRELKAERDRLQGEVALLQERLQALQPAERRLPTTKKAALPNSQTRHG